MVAKQYPVEVQCQVQSKGAKKEATVYFLAANRTGSRQRQLLIVMYSHRMPQRQFCANETINYMWLWETHLLFGDQFPPKKFEELN